MSTSAALFLQSTLYWAHQDVIAEKSNVKSSFLASSSAGAACEHSLTNSYKSETSL